MLDYRGRLGAAFAFRLYPTWLKMLKIKTILRHSDIDDWGNGCDLQSSKTDFPEWEAQSFENPRELIAWIKDKNDARFYS